MDPIRRQTLMLALAFAGAVLPMDRATASSQPAEPGGCASVPKWSAGIAGQRRADLGDGRFLNPVLAANREDPNVLKDRKDHYATFSSFDYHPAGGYIHNVADGFLSLEPGLYAAGEGSVRFPALRYRALTAAEARSG